MRTVIRQGSAVLATSLWVTCAFASTAAAHTSCNYNAQFEDRFWTRFHDHADPSLLAYVFHEQEREARLEVVASDGASPYDTRLLAVCAAGPECQADCGVVVEAHGFSADGDLDSADLSVTCPRTYPILTEISGLIDADADEGDVPGATDDLFGCDAEFTREGVGYDIPASWWTAGPPTVLSRPLPASLQPGDDCVRNVNCASGLCALHPWAGAMRCFTPCQDDSECSHMAGEACINGACLQIAPATCQDDRDCPQPRTECRDPERCQGASIRFSCQNNLCQGDETDDDSACADRVANTCGIGADRVCSSRQRQSAPRSCD